MEVSCFKLFNEVVSVGVGDSMVIGFATFVYENDAARPAKRQIMRKIFYLCVCKLKRINEEKVFDTHRFGGFDRRSECQG
jgi:hypothetical protein